MATAGVMLGRIFHTVFAAVCIGVLTTLPSYVFTVILLAGAAYMAWIGWTLVKSTITVSSLGSTGSISMRQGFITCVLNSKAYLFTVAVYPQFMLPKFGTMLGQALVLGLITIVTQGLVYGGLGLAAAKCRDFLTGYPGVTTWIGKGAGAVFLAVAAWTVVRLWSG
jgi:threonine/homoserine/homoserine lactone efflux protein